MHRTFCLALLLLGVPGARAYSVLTHEAIIDSAWERDIKPLLIARFPQAGPEDLLHAHAFAYAGCIIQDMGYYPFGSKFFSDLVHYVRSGDFVVNLIAESQDLGEYAFALGALAHYAADNEGHRIAVNPSVALEYPELQRKYGPVVTYAENPSAHLKTEFGFDVLQVARGRYAPQAYHDFIGFEVSKPVLERAFRDTYSLQLEDVFTNTDLALGTYRRTVSKVIPEMTRVAWRVKKNDLQHAAPGITRRKFVYNLSRASYRKQWNRNYQKTGAGTFLLSIFFRIVPKIGPFRAAGFKVPTRQTESLFEQSFDRTLDFYRRLLADAGRQSLALENRDFDTGAPTRAAEYQLADSAYSRLAIKLAEKELAAVDLKVVANILGYYGNLNAPYTTKRDPQQWEQTTRALAKLRMEPASPKPPAAPESALPAR